MCVCVLYDKSKWGVPEIIQTQISLVLKTHGFWNPPILEPTVPVAPRPSDMAPPAAARGRRHVARPGARAPKLPRAAPQPWHRADVGGADGLGMMPDVSPQQKEKLHQNFTQKLDGYRSFYSKLDIWMAISSIVLGVPENFSGVYWCFSFGMGSAPGEDLTR